MLFEKPDTSFSASDNADTVSSEGLTKVQVDELKGFLDGDQEFRLEKVRDGLRKYFNEEIRALLMKGDDTEDDTVGGLIDYTCDVLYNKFDNKFSRADFAEIVGCEHWRLKVFAFRCFEFAAILNLFESIAWIDSVYISKQEIDDYIKLLTLVMLYDLDNWSEDEVVIPSDPVDTTSPLPKIQESLGEELDGLFDGLLLIGGNDCLREMALNLEAYETDFFMENKEEAVDIFNCEEFAGRFLFLLNFCEDNIASSPKFVEKLIELKRILKVEMPVTSFVFERYIFDKISSL